MPAPKRAVRVETRPMLYCASCFTTAAGPDRFCADCGTTLARRLVRVVACECDAARELVGPVPDPYRIPDPRVVALASARFCPHCGTSTEKLVAEWELEHAMLAAAAAGPPA